ncbi:MAG: PAS domain-containing protein, partial [Candidatus Saccharimonadales bacterium]
MKKKAPNIKVDPDKSTLADLSKIYGHRKIGILTIDALGMITYFNAAVIANSGLDKQDLSGQSLFTIFTDASPNGSNESRLRSLTEITDQEFKVNGQPEGRWVLISSEVLDSGADANHTILFIRDITKSKKKEKLFTYLNQAAADLAKTRDTPTALDKIARFIVPAFADWFT